MFQLINNWVKGRAYRKLAFNRVRAALFPLTRRKVHRLFTGFHGVADIIRDGYSAGVSPEATAVALLTAVMPAQFATMASSERRTAVLRALEGAASRLLQPMFDGWAGTAGIRLFPGTVYLCADRPVELPDRYVDLREFEHLHAVGHRRSQQGIAKAGNRYIPAMGIEIAWGWLRFQPESALSRWYQERFGQGSSRIRRIGIVALARGLLVALWRYLETGVVPEGAVLTA